MVDLLFASCGIEPEIVAASEVVQIEPGLSVPVAATGHLAAMKLLARADNRPHDAADLIALSDVLSEADRDLARVAVALIGARGFDRGRDLVSLLEEYLRSESS